MSSSSVNASSQNLEVNQTALKLLSDTSGSPIASIRDSATLQELGIGSLSAVELKGDLENAFKIEIEDGQVYFRLHVKEILDFLGVGSASQDKKSSPAIATRPIKQANLDK